MHRVLGGEVEGSPSGGGVGGAGASSSSAPPPPGGGHSPERPTSPFAHCSAIPDPAADAAAAAATEAEADAEAEAASAAAAEAAAAVDADAAEGRHRARQARLASSLSGLSGGGGSRSRLRPVAEDRAATPAGATPAAAAADGGPFGGKDATSDKGGGGAGGGEGAGADDVDARLLALADEPRFAPFVRQDAYGQGGAGPWTWGERARLAGCALALVPLRALAVALCVGAYYATCRAAAALPPPRTARGQAARRSHLARAGRFWSRACLLALGFWRVRWLRVAPDGARTAAGPPWRRRRLGPADEDASGAGQQQQQHQHQQQQQHMHQQQQQLQEQPQQRERQHHHQHGGEGGGEGCWSPDCVPPPPAVVANHVSWLDILLVMSRYFPSFVAREGTQDLPLIGLISRQMQCLFVDRERRGQQQQQGQQQAGQQQGAAAAAEANGGGGGGGGPAPTTGSSVSAAVRARMRRSAARTGLLEAMMDAEDDAAAAAAAGGGAGAGGAAAAAAAGVGLASAPSGGAAAAAAATDNADDAGGDAAAERPMLLFPEGTTSNGRYLLPFRTGAFLAGVPVRPVVISYASCGGGLAGGRRPGGVLPRRRTRGGSGGGGEDGGGGGGGGFGGGGGGGAPDLDLDLDRYCDTGGGSGGGRLSLAWESITAATHVLLVLASPWQSATCLELPLYVPSAEERADARLFASRVRGELLRATALLPSGSGLEEKREYQRRLREVLAARDPSWREK